MISADKAWAFIQMVLPRVRGDVTRMKEVLDRSDKDGLYALDAVDAARARDELREIADDLNSMIGSKDMKDAA